MSTNPRVYASNLSPFSGRLRIAAALKNIEIDFELPPGGSGSAQIKAINPFGKIPIMFDGDHTLVESFALLEYLEDARPGTRSLRPADAAQLARVRALVLLFDYNVLKAMGGVFAQLLSPTPNADLARAAFDDIEAELNKLVHFFDAEGPAIGGALTIADCAMAPFAFLMDTLAPVFGVVSPTQRVPRFAAWWKHVAAVPEVAKVTAGMAQAFAAMAAARKAAAQN